MGFFSAVKKFFSGGSHAPEEVKQEKAPESPKEEVSGQAEEKPQEAPAEEKAGPETSEPETADASAGP